jgi:hypothetical protein
MTVWMVLTTWMLVVPLATLALSALAARRAARTHPPVEIPAVPRLAPAGQPRKRMPCESRRRPTPVRSGRTLQTR